MNSNDLIDAVKNDDVELVKTLITNGADLDARDSNGDRAFEIATKNGNSIIVKLLKRHALKNIAMNDKIVLDDDDDSGSLLDILGSLDHIDADSIDCSYDDDDIEDIDTLEDCMRCFDGIDIDEDKNIDDLIVNKN